MAEGWCHQWLQFHGCGFENNKISPLLRDVSSENIILLSCPFYNSCIKWTLVLNRNDSLLTQAICTDYWYTNFVKLKCITNLAQESNRQLGITRTQSFCSADQSSNCWATTVLFHDVWQLTTEEYTADSGTAHEHIFIVPQHCLTREKNETGKLMVGCISVALPLFIQLWVWVNERERDKRLDPQTSSTYAL